MNHLPAESSGDAWIRSVMLLERWLGQRVRLDGLLEEAGGGRGFPRGRAAKLRGGDDEARAEHAGPAAWIAETAGGRERARCQHLLVGAVRNLGRLDAIFGAMVPRPPRARLKAILLVAGFELLEAGAGGAGEAGRDARIVHHAVARSKRLLSQAEARLINAVLRRAAGVPALRAAPPRGDAGAPELARHYSHPEWLVRRWLAQFGSGSTRALLEWNQTPPPIHARWRGRPGAAEAGPPAFLQPDRWEGFYTVPPGHWPEIERLLAEGALYLQDPATLIAPGLLEPKAGETVADFCAAPGGKSLFLADLLDRRARLAGPGAGTGRVVAINLPDPRRMGRLKENLARARGTDVVLIQADVRELSRKLLGEHRLPAEFPAVLIDVPCSNTGVMRHRVDVKWRLRESDIPKHAGQQLVLLGAAARLVAPGGRLVYSTCSLEPEENEGVVNAFLRGTGGRFALERTQYSRPWESGCDGAGAFLLRRSLSDFVLNAPNPPKMAQPF